MTIEFENIAMHLGDTDVFINTFNNIECQCYNNPSELLMDLKQLEKKSFYVWLHKQPNFLKAKDRLIKSRIIANNLDDVSSEIQRDYLRQFSLEYACATVICHVAKNPELVNAIVVPKKWKEYVEKYHEKLALMARNFELLAEEQLFLSLLNRLKKSNGSVLNSGKKHAMQLREYMIKMLVEVVASVFESGKVSNILLANISLDITQIFFASCMKQSDAEELVKKIKRHTSLNSEFLQKTVLGLLGESI